MEYLQRKGTFLLFGKSANHCATVLPRYVILTCWHTNTPCCYTWHAWLWTGKNSLSSNLLTIYHALVSERLWIYGVLLRTEFMFMSRPGVCVCVWVCVPQDGCRARSFLGVRRESQLLSSNPHKQGAATTSHRILSPPPRPLRAAAGDKCTRDTRAIAANGHSC